MASLRGAANCREQKEESDDDDEEDRCFPGPALVKAEVCDSNSLLTLSRS